MILMVLSLLILLSMTSYWYFEKQRIRRNTRHLENRRESLDKLLESIKKGMAEDNCS